MPAGNYQNRPWFNKVVAKIKWYSFYLAALNAGLSREKGIRLSVCPSNAWIVTKRKNFKFLGFKSHNLKKISYDSNRDQNHRLK